MLTTVISILTLSSICLSSESPPLVITSLGSIRGHHKFSFSKKTYSAFEGIPYAQPPIGENRFEPPKPVEKWSGIWNAQSLYTCAQTPMDHKNLKVSGTEDCLYLNIYVPRTQINPTEKLKVIVHIHGGGFFFGSGHDYAFPGYLMDRDVIFVTFNYRLGILGFLSTDDEVIPGNNGLKDQVMALEWIKTHIDKFGGDPNDVTLTGASAGGAAVHLHYFSPKSSNLFKRGFSQSGAALNPWVIKRNNLEKTQRLAEALGCPVTPKDLKVCLKERHVDQILSKVSVAYKYRNFPICPFGPVVEKSTDPFLTEEPYVLLVKKQVKNVPWMASFVPQEMDFLFRSFEKETEELNRVWNKFGPSILSYDTSLSEESKFEAAAKKILDFYLGEDKTISKENFDKFIKLASDRMFIDGIVESTILQTEATNAGVYLFELSYNGKRRNNVAHTDDNQYFFYNATGVAPTPEDVKMKDVLIEMLVNYVETNKPKIGNLDWKPIKPNSFNFVNITGYEEPDFKIETDKNVGNSEFWRSLVTKYLSMSQNFNFI